MTNKIKVYSTGQKFGNMRLVISFIESYYSYLIKNTKRDNKAM